MPGSASDCTAGLEDDLCMFLITLTVSAMTVNHRAVTEESVLEGTLIPQKVERNIHANQKEERRNLLPFLVKKKIIKKKV